MSLLEGSISQWCGQPSAEKAKESCHTSHCRWPLWDCSRGLGFVRGIGVIKFGQVCWTVPNNNLIFGVLLWRVFFFFSFERVINFCDGQVFPPKWGLNYCGGGLFSYESAFVMTFKLNHGLKCIVLIAGRAGVFLRSVAIKVLIAENKYIFLNTSEYYNSILIQICPVLIELF